MNAHASLLGIYEPGDGWLFRLPIGAKYQASQPQRTQFVSHLAKQPSVRE